MAQITDKEAEERLAQSPLKKFEDYLKKNIPPAPKAVSLDQGEVNLVTPPLDLPLIK